MFVNFKTEKRTEHSAGSLSSWKMGHSGVVATRRHLTPRGACVYVCACVCVCVCVW